MTDDLRDAAADKSLSVLEKTEKASVSQQKARAHKQRN